jgi:hypothetical protein
MFKSERNTLNSLNDNPGPTNYDGAVAIKYKKKPPTIMYLFDNIEWERQRNISKMYKKVLALGIIIYRSENLHFN